MQDAHHHVFQAAGRWNGGHAKLDVLSTILLELYLAVLGLAAFGNVQIRHDLDAGNNGSAVTIRNRLVKLANPIRPEPNLGVFLAGIRFDMNI